MKSHAVHRLVLVALTMASASCAEGGAPRQVSELVTPTVRDSAGVRIVENRVPQRGVPPYAVVDSVPSLDIGAAAGGDPHYVLSDVRGAHLLSDGRVVVANGGTREIRYYRADGSYVGTVGGPGTRPGRYRSLTRMGRTAGDSVWVFDAPAGRFTILGPDGTLRGTATMKFTPWGRFGDGSFLLVPSWSLADHPGVSEGLRRDTATWLRWWSGPGDTVEVGRFPQDEVMVVDTGGALVAAVPPYGRRTNQAVGSGRFYIGDEVSFDIRGYDPDGTLREIIRLAGVDLTLSPEEVARNRERATGGDNLPAWKSRFWDAAPSTRPAYSRLLLDAGGNLWVGEHVAVADFPRNWLVFSADGSLVGLVDVPTHFAPFEIGVDYLLGLEVDAPGVEHVREYRMRREE